MEDPRFNLDNFVFLPVQAQVTEFEATPENLKGAILAALEKAKATTETAGVTDPIGSNGLPRMLQLSGWITFADEINKNYRMFTPEDLEEAVANGMFKAPFFGMIDYNHDFQLYGVWYDAKYAFDEASGKWGIYGEGVMFAWRFPELADKMLAMQARQGHIDLSMACLAEYYESSRTEDGIDYLIARKPVFFTTSLLDVDPAFPNSRAIGSEDPESTQEQRAKELVQNGLGTRATEEASMKVEKTEAEKLAAEKAAAEKEAAEKAAAEKAEAEKAEAERLEAEKAAAEKAAAEKAEAEKLAAEKAAQEQAELEAADKAAVLVKLQTATVALEAAKAEIDRLSGEVESLTKFKTEVEAARATEAATKVREARMAELPETLKVEMAKEENAALLNEWMTMEEAKWEATKNVFSLASSRKSFSERSADEGVLSGTSDRDIGEFAISKHKLPARRKATR